jgi:hypothetical protein
VASTLARFLRRAESYRCGHARGEVAGPGNHFLVVERPPWPLTPERVRLLCDAALGLGADGVLEVALGDDSVPVVVHNRDGSIAEISGNGTRIAAAYAARRLGLGAVQVRTGAGAGEAHIGADGRIAVRLGAAALEGPQEDLGAPDPGIAYRFVSTGNPHCVLTVADPGAFAYVLHASAMQCAYGLAIHLVPSAIDRERARVALTGCACGSGARGRRDARLRLGVRGRRGGDRRRSLRLARDRQMRGSVEVGVDSGLGLTLTGTAQPVYVAELDRRCSRRWSVPADARCAASTVPEYLSTRLMRTVAEARARGVDVISLGIGDPDTPPRRELREELCAHARRLDIHGYPTNQGIAPARGRRSPLPQPLWRGARSRLEIPPLLGAKEGLAHSASPSSIRATWRSSRIRATPSTTAGPRSRAVRPSASRCAPSATSCPISARSARP